MACCLSWTGGISSSGHTSGVKRVAVASGYCAALAIVRADIRAVVRVYHGESHDKHGAYPALSQVYRRFPVPLVLSGDQQFRVLTPAHHEQAYSHTPALGWSYTTLGSIVVQYASGVSQRVTLHSLVVEIATQER